MVTKCRFCNYSKETKLSRAILSVIADKELPEEDYMIWIERLIKHHGLKDYTSVKIHMGIKHKEDTYKYISPVLLYDAVEKKIING
jgi:hypothetical protein